MNNNDRIVLSPTSSLSFLSCRIHERVETKQMLVLFSPACDYGHKVNFKVELNLSSVLHANWKFLNSLYYCEAWTASVLKPSTTPCLTMNKLKCLKAAELLSHHLDFASKLLQKFLSCDSKLRVIWKQSWVSNSRIDDFLSISILSLGAC